MLANRREGYGGARLGQGSSLGFPAVGGARQEHLLESSYWQCQAGLL